MTEIYHGPWNPAVGEKKTFKFPDDVYHRYPASSQVKKEAVSEPERENQPTAQMK